MFEFTYDHLPDTAKYLERIGFDDQVKVDIDCLNSLIWHHQCYVPFEDLSSAMLDEKVSLDTEVLYDKVVNRKRGGFCFELNGLFMMLLRDLGFDAYSVMCRVESRREELTPVMHRGILVFLDGKRYFCDVGFGGPMAPFAVELSEEKQTYKNETYWCEEIFSGWHMIYRGKGKGYGEDGSNEAERQTVVMFSESPFLNADFKYHCNQCANSPDSGFRKMRMCNKRTEEGYVSLMGNKFTEVSNAGKTEKEVEEKDIPKLLKEYFGIEY